MTYKKYNWKRYWIAATPNTQIFLTDGGFLQPPTGDFGKYINPELTEVTSLNSTTCLILLGEPGIGKSTEIKNLYGEVSKVESLNNTLWINLRDIPSPEIFRDELEKSPQYQNWVNKGEKLYLFLDSFDEGIFSIKSFANYFVLLLKKNSDKIKNLHLRLSCRTAIWQPYLDESLQDLWVDDDIKKYELCPLIKEDVITALKAKNIDVDNFLAEINEKSLVGLAGKPLTLNFLMEVYEKNNSLPKRKADIYSQGCELLAQEPDQSKKISPQTRPTLNLNERMAIAERIAFATIIGGKQVITLNQGSTISESEVSLTDLGGTEIVNDTSLNIGESQIAEVLNTGLFSSRGDGKMGWAHQSYGEFLAARYIFRHKLNWKQTRSFLFQDPLKNGIYQVVPQLYEVSEWLASLDSYFFDRTVLLDPESLLLSDVNVASDKQKETLVGQLLLRLAHGDLLDRWETFNKTNYKKLCHPNLLGQLQTYIKDPSLGIVVRRSAIEMVIACEVRDLSNFLSKIALDKKEELVIRARAAHAIAEIGTDEAKKSLKPLLESGLEKDPEDELKGVVLKALWPKNISASELFKYITAPKRPSLFGMYYSFIENDLVPSLRAEDVLAGLKWIENNPVDIRSLDYSLSKLTDSVMLKAWRNVTATGFLETFSRIAYRRLKRYEEIIGEQRMNDEFVNQFKTSLEENDSSRRALLKQLILLLSQETENIPGKKGTILLSHNKVRLFLPKDVPWLISWLDEEKNGDIQKLLAEIIGRVFDVKNVRDIELVYKTRATNVFLKQETFFWFETIQLDSEEAKNQRDSWREQQSWQEKREKSEKDEILKVISLDRITDLLAKCEAGEPNLWWQLNTALCMYNYELEEDDITKMPGWSVIDELTRQRIIESGKAFLASETCKPEMWLGIGKVYFPAMSGYRELKFLYEHEPDFIKKMGNNDWERWAPIVVGLPAASNEPENAELVALAYSGAPDSIISTLEVLVDQEEKQFGNLFVLRLLDKSVDSKLSEFLLKQTKKVGLKSKAFGDLINFLLEHKVVEAKTYVKSLITVPLPTDKDERDRCLAGATSLLWNADSEDWDFIWDLIKRDNEFGRLLIEKAHDSPLSGSGVLRRLGEKQLADLYVWMMGEFPPEKYSEPEGGHTITPQMSIGNWRDSVMRILMDKGTADGCLLIERIADQFPQYTWIKQYTVLEARRIALQKSWQPAPVNQMLKMIENHELRLINSEDELMDIVVDSIARFQDNLQKQEQPEAIHLWNEKQSRQKKGGKMSFTYSPKDENRLSDEVKTHLDKDLVGIVVGREVEIQRGSKTDVHISTFNKDSLGRPKDLLKIIIEVKGCWNNELDTAMEIQLSDKYLKGTGCDHGIYLIGWFQCPKWNDSADSRITKCPKITYEDAKEKFTKQAEELSSKKALKLVSIVLDVRLS